MGGVEELHVGLHPRSAEDAGGQVQDGVHVASRQQLAADLLAGARDLMDRGRLHGDSILMRGCASPEYPEPLQLLPQLVFKRLESGKESKPLQ